MKKITLPHHSKLLSPNFTFGVATSSFQIEGGRNSRLDNIWDTFAAQAGTISDQSNGDVACDHLNRWQEDVDLICDLGVDAYRLSIAWPRVINADGEINESGMAFYETLIDQLNHRGVQVYVTLYHWDLPQHLEDNGGWLNRETAYAFQEYVYQVANRLGERVAAYITLNEPYCAGYLSYEQGVHAPGKTGVKNGRQASHNLLLAHGLGMQALRRAVPNVPAGIVLNIHPGYPASDNPADKDATRLATEWMFTWYFDPILRGEYPSVMARIDPADRPQIGPQDMQIIAAEVDFIGLNYYTRNVYQSDGQGWFTTLPAQPPLTEMGWEITPSSLTEMLVDLHQQYTLPPIYITENGAAMPDRLVDGQVDDPARVAYFDAHLNAVHDALEQGVDVRGYFAWSLLDNFEWALGYSKRFGIYYVDYATQQRYPKTSALAYQALLAYRAQLTVDKKVS